MKVIFGLGNPGLRYGFTRHNVGFLVVKALAQLNNIKINQHCQNVIFGKGKINNQEVLLGFPLTFMNLSGQAASSIVKQNKIKRINLLIVCDDINLPLGKIRLRAQGSAGGHQGLSSIIQALGSEIFPRLRIGIGSPPTKKEKASLSDYVLDNFNKRETKIIQEAIQGAVSCCQSWLKEGIAPAMNRFNQKGD